MFGINTIINNINHSILISGNIQKNRQRYNSNMRNRYYNDDDDDNDYNTYDDNNDDNGFDYIDENLDSDYEFMSRNGSIVNYEPHKINVKFLGNYIIKHGDRNENLGDKFDKLRNDINNERNKITLQFTTVLGILSLIILFIIL